MVSMVRRSALQTIAAAALGFAAIMCSAAAPSAAASYTLHFTGTVTDTAGAFSALGILAGDPLSGSLTISPINTDSFTTELGVGVRNVFLQGPFSTTFNINVSNPGNADIDLTNMKGGGQVWSTHQTAVIVNNSLVFDLAARNATLLLSYFTQGSGTPLTSLAGLPTSSAGLIALLGGHMPSAFGQFQYGSVANEIDFDVAFAPTPIPATLPLFGAALGGLGLVGWRRRHRISNPV